MSKILTTKEIGTKHFGKNVIEYECYFEKGYLKWKVYYADGKNVYIIMDDYVPISIVPHGKNRLCVLRLSPVNDKLIDFGENVLDGKYAYNFSKDIKNPKIRDLNSLYFKSCENQNTNINMRAVAYLLDTEAWSDFAGEKAEYAIGSPTIELFVKSYNLINERKIVISSNKIGYKIAREGENTNRYRYPGYCVICNENSKEEIYFKERDNPITSAFGMWFASPSAYGGDQVMTMFNGGGVGFATCSGLYHALLGFRPVVCLNSDVCFEETEEGLRII